MIQNFFRKLEELAVQYLLISGQASVLYGASTFSEDIDLWLAPTSLNFRRFTKALSQLDAAVYKLTPPLEPGYAKRGHGFHFLLPDEYTPAYLDVMGKPPRVGSFRLAHKKSNRILCDWGKIPVVSIRDLVELKKTRRLADYEVISNLVKIHLSDRSKQTDLEWGLKNVFRIEDADWIFKKIPNSRKTAIRIGRKWLKAMAESGTNFRYQEIQSLLAQEIASLQHQDVLYWQPVIEELRTMRKNRILLKQGTPVQSLITGKN